MPEQALQAIARVAMMRHVARNASVVHAGDRTDFVYLILSGSLKVLVSDEEGREVILSMLGPGELFGEMGVLDDNPRSATVSAVEPCDLVIISKHDFQRFLQENFDVSHYIMRNLVQRLREADRKIESLALMDVYGRVARLLLDMAETVEWPAGRHAQDLQAGHRQDDRRLARDGEPRHEGPADAGSDRRRRRQDHTARSYPDRLTWSTGAGRRMAFVYNSAFGAPPARLSLILFRCVPAKSASLRCPRRSPPCCRKRAGSCWAAAPSTWR
ncbi:MAG: cyclic nucleotide-binding domain-containing protein [Comamonadaceae bacterium]|nr:cyclic nucleotide-binding domain-containing protein [Comamonadaceae bacterium]